jgi:PPOX class probable F420-dependent enzyme
MEPSGAAGKVSGQLAALIVVAPPSSHLDLLERPLVAHLAIVRPDGAPQVNPMWFVWDGAIRMVKISLTKSRHTYECIQQEPRVALSITDPDDQYRYIQLRGVAELEDDETGDFYRSLEQRYNRRVVDLRDRVVATISPTAFKVRSDT